MAGPHQARSGHPGNDGGLTLDINSLFSESAPSSPFSTLPSNVKSPQSTDRSGAAELSPHQSVQYDLETPSGLAPLPQQNGQATGQNMSETSADNSCSASDLNPLNTLATADSNYVQRKTGENADASCCIGSLGNITADDHDSFTIFSAIFSENAVAKSGQVASCYLRDNGDVARVAGGYSQGKTGAGAGSGTKINGPATRLLTQHSNIKLNISFGLAEGLSSDSSDVETAAAALAENVLSASAK